MLLAVTGLLSAGAPIWASGWRTTVLRALALAHNILIESDGPSSGTLLKSMWKAKEMTENSIQRGGIRILEKQRKEIGSSTRRDTNWLTECFILTPLPPGEAENRILVGHPIGGSKLADHPDPRKFPIAEGIILFISLEQGTLNWQSG